MSQRAEEQAAALNEARNQNAELGQRVDALSQSRDSEREGRLAAEERCQTEGAALEALRAAVAHLEEQLEETKSSLKVDLQTLNLFFVI